MAEGLKKQKSGGASIKWKIFLFMLVFCLLLLVVLWLFQTVLLDSFYTGIKLRQVEKEADTLAELLKAGEMDDFEARIRQRGDLYVELVAPDGSQTVVEGFMPEFGMDSWNTTQRAALYQQATENGGSLSQRYEAQDPPQLPKMEELPVGERGEEDPTPPDGGQGSWPNGKGPGHWGVESVLHAKIVQTPDGQQTMLLVRAAITPISATVQTLQVQLWVVSAIMLVLAVGIALLLSRRVARPIEKLNHTAAELGRGNYAVTFEGGGYREAEELAGTLNRAAAELDKTETLRRELIANVSHDLRTPLTLITGYAEMMRDIPGENSPENMQVIIEEARRLSSLVGDLLDLSQLQSGTSPPRLESFSLTGEIEAIIGRFSKLGAPEGARVVFSHGGGQVWVTADRARIAQVVYNLLINALTHGGADKAITVTQTLEKERVTVEVKDTGPGIPPEALPYIWERYYKVDKAHKRAAAGSGLGLSIVKNILQQHPGMEYGVYSGEGGTSFWFSLPGQDAPPDEDGAKMALPPE